MVGDWEHPCWNGASKVHDWKNYASEPVKAMWPSLTGNQKVAIASMLQDIADEEEWD